MILVSLIAGTIGTVVFAVDADRERGRAEAKIDEFNLLSGVVRLRNAINLEQDLFPAWPKLAGPMQGWLDEHAQPLLDSRDRLDAALQTLRRRALP